MFSFYTFSIIYFVLNICRFNFSLLRYFINLLLLSTIFYQFPTIQLITFAITFFPFHIFISFQSIYYLCLLISFLEASVYIATINPVSTYLLIGLRISLLLLPLPHLPYSCILFLVSDIFFFSSN